MLNRKKIALNYIKTWFLFDFLSSLPLDLIILRADSNMDLSYLLRVNNALRLIKILRLPRAVPPPVPFILLRFSLLLVPVFFQDWGNFSKRPFFCSVSGSLCAKTTHICGSVNFPPPHCQASHHRRPVPPLERMHPVLCCRSDRLSTWQLGGPDW